MISMQNINIFIASFPLSNRAIVVITMLFVSNPKERARLIAIFEGESGYYTFLSLTICFYWVLEQYVHQCTYSDAVNAIDHHGLTCI